MNISAMMQMRENANKASAGPDHVAVVDTVVEDAKSKEPAAGGPPRLPNRWAADDPSRPPMAALFTLTAVDRNEHPAGRHGGPPGGPVHELIQCSDTGKDVDLSTAFGLGSHFILYAVETEAGQLRTPDSTFLVFIELGDTAKKERLIKEEAFIDRGARKMFPEGARVLVATLAAAERFVKNKDLYAPFREGKFGVSVIWNCGRCGSTLMHKALLRAGVVSLSEPQWADQLGGWGSGRKGTTPASPKLLERVFRCCWTLEVELARALPCFADATRFSLNPMAKGALSLIKPFHAAFPMARCLFMYRSCEKVVTSFTGLMQAQESAESVKAQNAKWEKVGIPMARGMASTKLRPLLAEGGPLVGPIGSLSGFHVVMFTLKWLGWMQAVAIMRAEPRPKGEPAMPYDAPFLRMDEFVGEDKRKVLESALTSLGVLSPATAETQLNDALEAFNEDSQKTSAMGKGTKKPNLSAEDIKRIRAAVVALSADLRGSSKHDKIIVEQDGANVVFPHSLGIPVGDTAPADVPCIVS